MKETLKDRMKTYEQSNKICLEHLKPIIIRLDGRSFSKFIKNKFEKPFDISFINMMNETAKYICENIQGATFAYVQSDEISILIYETNVESSPWFGNNIQKITSITAAMAASKFNQLMLLSMINNNKYETTLEDCENTIYTIKDIERLIKEKPLLQFDSRCFNLPEHEIFNYFLYRQTDCIRNSKQQTAQTYLPHKMLHGLDTDKQIELLKETKGIDWNAFPDDRKYGRFIERREIETTVYNNYLKQEVNVVKKEWTPFPAYYLKDNRESFELTHNIPIKE